MSKYIPAVKKINGWFFSTYIIPDNTNGKEGCHTVHEALLEASKAAEKERKRDEELVDKAGKKEIVPTVLKEVIMVEDNE